MFILIKEKINTYVRFNLLCLLSLLYLLVEPTIIQALAQGKRLLE